MTMKEYRVTRWSEMKVCIHVEAENEDDVIDLASDLWFEALNQIKNVEWEDTLVEQECEELPKAEKKAAA
jgi:deferrochelatase/peroxidase EfeB